MTGDARGGNDFLSGGEGDDIVTGDTWNKLAGNSRGGDDDLHGGNGNDQIYGDCWGNLGPVDNAREETTSSMATPATTSSAVTGSLSALVEQLLSTPLAAATTCSSGGTGNDLLFGDAGFTMVDATVRAGHPDRRRR